MKKIMAGIDSDITDSTHSPVADNQSQVADNQSQVADNQSQVADNQSQVADNQSQVADNQSQVADNQSQVADNQSPVARNHSPAEDDDVTVAGDYSSVAGDPLSVADNHLQGDREPNEGQGPPAAARLPVDALGIIRVYFKIWVSNHLLPNSDKKLGEDEFSVVEPKAYKDEMCTNLKGLTLEGLKTRVIQYLKLDYPEYPLWLCVQRAEEDGVLRWQYIIGGKPIPERHILDESTKSIILREVAESSIGTRIAKVLIGMYMQKPPCQVTADQA
ncbi:hypothetical protein Pst134EB_001761 [Puccinia striiformis f. sp. tritici]|nr:hypothetical protein Pst134EB_001761 [Puccinia striiformis f. sp. tritici]